MKEPWQVHVLEIRDPAGDLGIRPCLAKQGKKEVEPREQLAMIPNVGKLGKLRQLAANAHNFIDPMEDRLVQCKIRPSVCCNDEGQLGAFGCGQVAECLHEQFDVGDPTHPVRAADDRNTDTQRASRGHTPTPVTALTHLT